MVNEELLLEAKEFFEFYKKEVGKYAKRSEKAIQVSFKELANFSHELADYVLTKPEDALAMLSLAIEELGLIKNPKVRLTEVPESQEIPIREIRAKHISQLLILEGIVRQASEVRPQVTNAKFECPQCGTIISVLQVEKKFREPNRCGCGRKAAFKLLSKELVDAQRLIIEESPEQMKGGEQPRRINVFLKEDLVDPKMEERTTPGSSVQVIGILKEIPVSMMGGGVSTRFDLMIEANNVVPQEESYEELEITEEEEDQIKELSSDPEIYKKLAASIAPSIFGYDEIKLAIALQLLAGIRKEKSDGTHARGDLHILLVGDPGVAKSVLLKFVSGIAPRARYIVGKAATQAGLTATVVKDEFLRGWALEAGAMVLANKGVACLDELEKMNEQDRSAMHEAMEQQTVTIVKANVQATLKAETSVLGAANPKFGRFDPFQPVAQQIELAPTLINRFDLIFVLKDIPGKLKDEAIASHVLREHKGSGVVPPIDPQLLRKYIAYAKQKISPELTEAAIQEIKKFYVELRNAPSMGDDLVKPIPISARQLEALVRLSQASAKARLSKKVTKEDARKAIQIMHFYLLQVGIDKESGSIDIDRIATGIPASQRSKIIIVRDTIMRLESKLGKLIPVKDLKKELEDKISEEEVDEMVDKLKRSGDVFEPKKGFVQRV
ncbi:MAG: minichromosome maintenance protein MCM [archaeon]|nr:MAG: minichromosome maintenance protein MCM [archaeon]